MALFLGIDLGTTNSAACVVRDGKLSAVRSAQGGVLTPSVVRMDGRGGILCGQRARKYLESDPDNTRSEFKRLMGTETKLAFRSANFEKRPEELAAIVLGSIRADVTREHGVTPSQAVITVPALFELPQSRATSDAARLAGFARVELLQEPVASALAAGWEDSGKKPWLVYDLGGGTFDVSLLEPQEGVLRVMGHDGDNFLGGRDIDARMLDHVLTRLEADGLRVDRRDPSVASGLRRLRAACEEAKLESSCDADASVVLPALALGAQTVDVDVVIPRNDMRQLALGIVDQSLLVCMRLLARHGLKPAQLERIVLVGGPTMMPVLKEALGRVLPPLFAANLDPMTLVAEGAARYAQTVNLAADSVPQAEATTTITTQAGIGTWFQYPAVTGDLGPFVVGKIVAAQDREKLDAVVFVRAHDAWESTVEKLDAEGTFATVVKLDERTVTSFRAFGIGKDGKRIPLEPATLEIRHGITIGDPPLPRSIGIALESGSVQTYFERGAPLPLKRSYTLQTAIPLGPQAPGSKLSIPIVQGEFPRADLCRLVGRLEIDGADVGSMVRPGTRVEVSLVVDRGGELRGSARIEGIERVFAHVVHLVAPVLTPNDVRTMVVAARDRLSYIFAKGSESMRARAERLDGLLDEVEAYADHGEGGDADALEKARRRLLDIDGELYELDAERAWPELEEECELTAQFAIVQVGKHGTATEQASLERAVKALGQATHARDIAAARKQLRYLDELGNTCYSRDPQAWENELEYHAGRSHEAFDLAKATQHIEAGRKAAAAQDMPNLKKHAIALRALMPASEIERKRSLGSGVR